MMESPELVRFDGPFYAVWGVTFGQESYWAASQGPLPQGVTSGPFPPSARHSARGLSTKVETLHVPIPANQYEPDAGPDDERPVPPLRSEPHEGRRVWHGDDQDVRASDAGLDYDLPDRRPECPVLGAPRLLDERSLLGLGEDSMTADSDNHVADAGFRVDDEAPAAPFVFTLPSALTVLLNLLPAALGQKLPDRENHPLLDPNLGSIDRDAGAPFAAGKPQQMERQPQGHFSLGHFVGGEFDS